MSTGTPSKPSPLRLVGPGAPRPDPQVAKAIALMREHLDKRWTVTSLARSVGLSRPVFARRFVEQTDLSPLRYLRLARMARAAELLRESNAGLAQIGLLVGYDSEFAFNRAFKRHHRLAPGNFRRRSSFAVAPTFRAAA